MKGDLHNDDCFEVLPSIKSQSINAIITDMPFGLVAADWDVAVPLDALWRELERIIKPNGAIVHCSVQPFTTELILSKRPWYRYSWYWLRSRKTNFVLANCQPLRVVEEIVVFSPAGSAPNAKPRTLYNPQMTPRERPIVRPNGRKQSVLTHNTLGNARKGKSRYTDRHPTNFLDKFPADNGSEACQKPLALVEYLVRTYTNKDDRVLDAFMGTGTTGVACQNLGRRFIGIEKSKYRFGLAEGRVRENSRRR